MTHAQRSATCHLDGPAMVIAGPGSGKTRVITYRIVHLINEHKIRPGNIMSITFTNKAADEMRSRVEKVLPRVTAKQVYISTFHALCARLLRSEYAAAGVDKNYTICDDGETKSYIVQSIAILTETHPRTVNGWKDYKGVAAAKKFISKMKQELKTPEDLYNEASDLGEEDEVQQHLRKVYEKYQRTLNRCHSVDFDDLLMKAVQLLESRPDIREKYSRRIHHLQVDEYQDTNYSQYRLVRLLSSSHNNITVVGDPDQSIYAFRGADITNITKLEKDYEGEVNTYYLEENFRSTPQIASAANQVISNNSERKDKEIKAVSHDGPAVRCMDTVDPKQEAAIILDDIKTNVARGKARYKDHAILYRMHSRSRIFEDLCVAHNIPYKIVGGLGFYNRAAVKDVIAYLRLRLNPYDEAAFLRIYDKPPRGFGDKSYAKLHKISEEKGISMVEVFKERHYEHILKGRPLAGARKLRETFKVLYQQPTEEVVPIVKTSIEASGYKKYLELEPSEDNIKRLDDIDELVSATTDFDKVQSAGLSRYIEWTSLMQSTDEDLSEDRLTMMTCHAAKGMEFKHVNLIGAIEGVLPIIRETNDDGSMKSPAQLAKDVEEERRVFFVAATRAEHSLMVTTNRTRFMYNQMIPCEPSRFIQEMGEEVEHTDADPTAGYHMVGMLERKQKSKWSNKPRFTNPKRRRKRRF